MLLQSDQTKAPPGIVPSFEKLAAKARADRVPNSWVQVPAQRISVGLDDVENDEGPDRYFGWDIEKPRRHVSVCAFEAKARPISVSEYACFLEQTSNDDALPAFWTLKAKQKVTATQELGVEAKHTKVNGIDQPLVPTDQYLVGKYVRTVYGPVPLRYAVDWPMMASYNELALCAAWMGGRIPSEAEARSLYEYAEMRKVKDAGSILSKKISAVNG